MDEFDEFGLLFLVFALGLGLARWWPASLMTHDVLITAGALGGLLALLWEASLRGPAQAAEQLLRDVLGEPGYAAYRRRGYVEIQSTLNPDRRYRISRGGRLERRRVDAYSEACVFTRMAVPRPDRVLTYVLQCRYNEQRMRETVNWHPWQYM